MVDGFFVFWEGEMEHVFRGRRWRMLSLACSFVALFDCSVVPLCHCYFGK